MRHGKKNMNSIEPHTTTPRWLMWTILVFLSGLLMAASAEVVLRIIPGGWSGNFFYIYDPDVGTWHLSYFSGDNVNTDYTIRNVSFNSFGMRDRERSLEKRPGVTRVAVLGDSFVEGLQVGDDEVFTAKMGDMPGGSVGVLILGVGGFGPPQECKTSLKKVRPF